MRLADFEPVERHEGDFTRQLHSIHLAKDLCTRLVIVNDMEEQSTASSDLNTCVEFLVTRKVLNQCAMVSLSCAVVSLPFECI